MGDYNYDAFSSGDYDFDTVDGPDVGEKAPDFLLTTSLGQDRHILDFEGEFLVLELGSITCPLFQSRRTLMQPITDQFEGVSSAILYVREAHPGSDIPAHQSFDDKAACARRLQHEDGESRLILIDGFDGAAHQAYGGMPNAVFIINRNGCIVYRSDWNNPTATRKALAGLLAGQSISVKSYFRPATPATALRTLRRAGKGSSPDFFKSLPALIWANVIKGNLRILFGRKARTSADTEC